jgi:carbamoyltransferase
LDYHPLHLFDARKRKERRLLHRTGQRARGGFSNALGRRTVIPAVTRVERSAGPQTVEKRINPVYWRLIDEFDKHTGVPVRLNTAANLRGEAIVDTPTDANRTLFSFAMDALALRSFLIKK